MTKIPPKVVLLGNKDAAEKFRAFGLSQLRILQESMALSGLKQDVRAVRTIDGIVVRAESVFGMDTVTINVPLRVPEEKIEEAIGVLKRIRISVVGTSLRMASGTPLLTSGFPDITGITGEFSELCIEDSAELTVVGGTAPFTWSVDDFPNFSLGALEEEEVETEGTTVDLNTVEGNCEDCVNVTVIDAHAKEKTEEFCRPEVDTLEWDWDESDEEIDVNSSCTVCVKGGAPPYTWEVVGEEFSFDDAETAGVCNTLNATIDARGTAVITVTDCCGSVLDGVYAVRVTSGSSWQVSSYTCCLTGIPEQVTESGGKYTYRLTLGGIRQHEVVERHNDTIAHGCDYPGTTRWWCEESPVGNCDPLDGKCLSIPGWVDTPPVWYHEGPCICVETANYASCYNPYDGFLLPFGAHAYICQTWEET